MFDLNALIGESRRVIIDLSGRQCSYRNLPAQRIADLRALCSQWLKADPAVDEEFEAVISFIKPTSGRDQIILTANQKNKIAV